MNTRAITQNKKVVTFGEVMLRLTAPNFQRFSQTNEFIATYGGSEANVAISLVNFGIPTEFVTRLPENAMAQACVNSLQAYGLGTDGIIYGGKRMGLYFLESGAAFRNSNVVYDREGSSFATLRPGMIDWEKILSDAGWFHWSGIAASLSQEGADACLEALQTADRLGLTISCDLNFRKKLWNYGKSASEVMLPLVQYSDVIFGAEPEYKEINYYLTKQNPYGLPLDSRKEYTKSDWIMWTAAMSSDLETFKKFIDPLYKYINETTSRVPISDWHHTDSGEWVGFKARSVIGGYWMQVLMDKTR